MDLKETPRNLRRRLLQQLAAEEHQDEQWEREIWEQVC